MCFNVVNLQLVADHHVKEKELEALTLIGFGNNIHTFLTTMEEKHNDINYLLPGKDEFVAHRFNTIMFDEITKSSCKDFLTNVK